MKGTIAGQERGGWRMPDGNFQMDRASEVLTDADLRLLATTPGQELTYTCVPPGSGQRLGVDRDGDGFLDRDEADVSSDPADARRVPPTTVRASRLSLRDDATAPFDVNKRSVSLRSSKYQGAPSGVAVPAWGSDGDPRNGGAILTLHATGSGTPVVVTLPAARWTTTGTAAEPGYQYIDRYRVDGPITRVTLRNGALNLRGRGAALYPLADAPHGTMVFRLEVGARLGYCGVAAAKDPVAENDTAAKFVGVRNSPAPPQCPPFP